MPLFAESDTVTILLAFFGLIGTMWGAWVTLQMRRADQLARQTHAVVNGSLGASLKVTAVALRRVAILTQLAADQDAADVAERAYREHQGRQVT